MRFLLIQPECECSITNTHTYTLPLGLGSIATYCRDRIFNLETKILDGSIMSHEEQKDVLKEFEPDVTGISPTIGSMNNTYDLAETARDMDSEVILGGVHATALWKNILRNDKHIDNHRIKGVILYDGEEAMRKYLVFRNVDDAMARDALISEIPNFGLIHFHNPRIETIFPANLPDIDYSLFDLEKHFEQTEKRGFGRAVSYYAGKGCSKRGSHKIPGQCSYEEYQRLVEMMDACTFCGRNELGLREFDEDREASIVRELHDKYGVTGFFNVQDTVNLKNTKPIGLDDSWFRLFIGLENVTKENIAKLKKRYGPNLIFQVGIESAYPDMRTRYGKKRMNWCNILNKTLMMREEGIQLHASYILGGKGETEDSMQMTIDSIKGIAPFENVSWILASPQLILPGSKDYKALLQMPGMMQKWGDKDMIDIPEINRDFLKWFAPGISRGYVLEQIKTAFKDIKTESPDTVLDVKGVVKEEEEYVGPYRPYSDGGKIK